MLGQGCRQNRLCFQVHPGSQLPKSVRSLANSAWTTSSCSIARARAVRARALRSLTSVLNSEMTFSISTVFFHIRAQTNPPHSNAQMNVATLLDSTIAHGGKLDSPEPLCAKCEIPEAPICSHTLLCKPNLRTNSAVCSSKPSMDIAYQLVEATIGLSAFPENPSSPQQK